MHQTKHDNENIRVRTVYNYILKSIRCIFRMEQHFHGGLLNGRILAVVFPRLRKCNYDQRKTCYRHPDDIFIQISNH